MSLDFDDWKEYSSVDLWVTALQQVLISNGIGTGIIATFSSYNDFSTYHIRGDACTLNVVGIIVNVVIGVLFTEVAGTFKYYTSSGVSTYLHRVIKFLLVIAEIYNILKIVIERC